MARGPRYKVPFRRRREGLTNYRKRRKLILSRKPRLVVRKTNKHVIAQVVIAKPHGDVTVVGFDTRVLYKFGWKGDENNTPSAYLLGLVVGFEARKRGIAEAVLDIGLHRPTPSSRIFAVLKGALDAGLKIPHSEDVLPDEDRITGKHIAEYAKMLRSENEDMYKARFSRYLARGIQPEEIPQHFEKVRDQIIQHYKLVQSTTA
ncbi:MAG: 50S ribosomal protein L18 [Pyrobaculum sp.]